jgi:hypothetical protein
MRPYASLLLIVTNSLASYLIFKKQQNNFAEHLVLNTFYRALSLLVSLLLLPSFLFFTYPDSQPNYIRRCHSNNRNLSHVLVLYRVFQRLV